MEKELLVLESDDGQVRARVHELPGGTYRVDVERLIAADDAGGVVHGYFWSVIAGLTSYADDEGRAKTLAQENLRCGMDAVG